MLKLIKRQLKRHSNNIKVYFRAKNITQDKESHSIIIKGSIHQEEQAILNTCALITNFKYFKQKLTELLGEIHESTSIIRGINTFLSIISRTSR